MAADTILNFWSQFGILLLALAGAAYIYVKHMYTYWERKGFASMSGTFPFGNYGQLLFAKKSFSDVYLHLYRKAKSHKCFGFYAFVTPELVITDLDLLKDILIKEFSTFTDRGIYVNAEVDPMSANIFNLEGLQWKNLRAKLSPTFTSGKMKIMYPTVRKCGKELSNYYKKVSENSKDSIVNFKDTISRYGLDVISTTAIGIQGNNLTSETEIKEVVYTLSNPGFVQWVRGILGFCSKKLANFFNIRLTPKAVEEFFLQVVRQTIDYRTKFNKRKNDFIQILIDLKNNGEGDEKTEKNGIAKYDQLILTEEEMAAQCFVFVAAGHETTSATVSLLMYELSLNPHVQDKLVAELDAAGPNPSYDVLLNLPYLDMVINETLRKHPPIPNLQRACSKDFTLPDGKVIPKGTNLNIPVIGLHRDPQLFPDPDKFDPERFSKDNINNIKPFSYLPFGDGPRMCIGTRFAKMQIKVAIAEILAKFQVEKCEKTPVPLVIDSKSFTYNSEGGMWLRIVERNPS